MLKIFFQDLKNLKLDIKGNLLHLIKDICNKSTINTMLHFESLNAFPARVRNKTKMFTPITSVQYYIMNPSHGNLQQKK